MNCTALPATLMEAELFGHERGAFTDAKESRMGLFEAAEGGFLFLDEVGDVELSLQGKLLKAVEERTVRRVGGIRDRKIDVRILAATNRDLERESQRERFRRDLYFRLAVILLRLPPLRERGRRRAAAGPALSPSGSAPSTASRCEQIDPRARDLLLAYPWPGNVRELSHVIERAVLGAGVRRWMSSTSRSVGARPTSVEPGADRARAGAEPDRPAGMDLEQWERSLIEQALRESDGNQTRAAQRLGITRDTLRYRLKKYGIQT